MAVAAKRSNTRHVDFDLSPQPMQHHASSQQARAVQGRSVGQSTMRGGSHYVASGHLGHHHQDLISMNTAAKHKIDRSAQQRDVVKFATTPYALPPTPPSTVGSASVYSGSQEDHGPDTMDPAAAATSPTDPTAKLLENGLGHSRRPFQQRHGRRYTRDPTYPLPCDLPELHRQNLRTSLACATFGGPVCCPNARESTPARILELGCGTGYWSAACHDAYSRIGVDNVEFTGMDLVPVASDLKKRGLNWTFVQHDIRRVPWPFDDESFDLVMWKDMSMVVRIGEQSQRVLNECIRVLRTGGTLEIWECDNLIRCMQPHSAPIVRDSPENEVASKTATFPIFPGTPFAPPQNKYLQAANKWINAALGQKGLASTPCARMASLLLQEPECLGDLGVRRVAIPLAGINAHVSASGKSMKSKSRVDNGKLHRDQLALRQTALLTVIQMIEGLEPLLKEVSGRSSEDWSRWWTSMMASLGSSEKRPLHGECLEIGAWWATKLDSGLR